MRHFSLLGLLLLSLGAAGCRNQVGSVETCTPGDLLDIGCEGSVGLRCTGDPTLTICDASLTSVPENCGRTAAGYLAFDDDGGDGLCPLVRGVTCPASGRISINPNPFSAGSVSWSCSYSVQRSALAP